MGKEKTQEQQEKELTPQDIEIRKFYAQWKEKSSYYFDRILITLSVWWFIYSLKFAIEADKWITTTLKRSRLMFLTAIILIAVSYYFSEKAYHKTYEEYENEINWKICSKCTSKASKMLNIYTIVLEISKVISLLSLILGLALLLRYYW